MTLLKFFIVVILVNNCAEMNISHDSIIRNLQSQVDAKNKALKELRNRLGIERNEHKQIIASLKTLQHANKYLENEIETLQLKLDEAEEICHRYRVKNHYKSFNELTSYSMRRQRKQEYRKVISNLFTNLKDIQRARLTLKLGKKMFTSFGQKMKCDYCMVYKLGQFQIQM